MRRLAAATAFAAALAPVCAGAAPQANLATRTFSLFCEIVKGEAVARNIRGVFIAKGTPVTITVRAGRSAASRRATSQVLRLAVGFDSLFDREEIGRARAPLGATTCAATAKGRSILRN